MCGHAMAGQLGAGGFECVGATCADRHRSALFSKGMSHGATDAAAAAGDQDAASGKLFG